MENKSLKTKALIAAVLSLITVIGGHFFNRRLDRFILYLSLFVLLIIIPAVIYYTSFMFIGPDGIEKVINIGTIISQTILWIAVFLWFASIITAARDAVNPVVDSYARLTAITIVSETVLSIFAGIIVWSIVIANIFFISVSGDGYISDMGDAADSDSSLTKNIFSTYSSKYFHNFINFGGHDYGAVKLEQLPEGSGYLTGKITFKDEPVVGLVFKIILNGRYEKDQIKTDENGRFQIRLPEGIWYINRIDSSSWDNKPADGDYLLVSDHEKKLNGNRYYRNQRMEDKGLEVQVTDNTDANSINLYVRDSVKVKWPAKDHMDDSVDINHDAITWLPYPDASRYHIKLTSIERKGTTTSYFPVLQTVVENQTLYPLKNLKIVESGDSGAESEYGVEITAFTSDGIFLSESEAFTPDTSFKLIGGLTILDEDSLRIFDSVPISSPADLQDLLKNRNRLLAIEVLIDDGKLDTASEMLQVLEGPLDAGKKKALEGYLLAKQGQCEEANKLFEQAVNVGGLGCVPSSYKEACNL